MSKTKTFRMQLSTYKKIRRAFKCQRGETVAQYFNRMANEMEKNRLSDVYMGEMQWSTGINGRISPQSHPKQLKSNGGDNVPR